MPTFSARPTRRAGLRPSDAWGTAQWGSPGKSILFADDIVCCGGKEDRGLRGSRPNTQFMDFTYEQSEQGHLQNSDQASNAVWGRNVSYNEETRTLMDIRTHTKTRSGTNTSEEQ